MSNSTRVVYRDLVHGPVTFIGKEAELINTAEMARLKEIRQLSTVYLFHAYANHSRFHHSAGVAWLAKFFIDALPIEHFNEVSLSDRVAFVAAALLHDIGHSAWSHVGEEFAKYRGEKILHDKRSQQLVLGDTCYDKYFARWDGLPRVRDVLADQSLREKVAALVVGDPPISSDMLEGKSQESREGIKREVTNSKGWMGHLIHSVFDLDRADYLMRDAFFTVMSSQALVDPVNLVQKTDFRMLGDRKTLVFCDLPFAESFVTSHELMYPSVYLETRNLVAEELLIRAFCRVFPKTTPIDDFWFATDQIVFGKLQESTDPFVQRVVNLMFCYQTYDIVHEAPLGTLGVQERENIVYLSENRDELLQVEQDIWEAAKTRGATVEREDFLLGIWCWPLPLEAKALIDVRGRLSTLGEESALLMALQSDRYRNGRSKLVIAAWSGVTQQDRIILSEETVRYLREHPIGA